MAAPRTQVIAFKVSTQELKAIRRGAKEEGINASEYCRRCVLRDRVAAKDPDIIAGLVTDAMKLGASYFKTGPTFEDLKEAFKHRLDIEKLTMGMQDAERGTVARGTRPAESSQDKDKDK